MNTWLVILLNNSAAKKHFAADLYLFELSSARPAAHFTLHKRDISSLLVSVPKPAASMVVSTLLT
ncbi:hypothetical protein BpHYR1_025102 [Brachionus plicatilis]|uniref:Uncharacterized protein n=1 Tax=Brachionus plicatilis TaxID=10195 RepID=A0A3M7RHA9_BRAPC|nr:hypothetical protein BpHYR1_025102 [Brachionus plicatilis]